MDTGTLRNTHGTHIGMLIDIPSTYYKSFGLDIFGELVDLVCQSQWYPILETYTGYGLVAVLASKWPGGSNFASLLYLAGQDLQNDTPCMHISLPETFIDRDYSDSRHSVAGTEEVSFQVCM